MDKYCVYALRKATGVTAVMGAVISFMLAFDLHASGTTLSAWNDEAGSDKSLYIKLVILGALALGYGIPSLKHFNNKLGAYIPAIIGVLTMLVCSVSFNELLAYFFMAAVLTVLSISTFFEHERTVIRWEKAPATSPDLYYY